jgi:hypothetical protein
VPPRLRGHERIIRTSGAHGVRKTSGTPRGTCMPWPDCGYSEPASSRSDGRSAGTVEQSSDALFEYHVTGTKAYAVRCSLVASEAWYGLDLFSRSQGATFPCSVWRQSQDVRKWMKPASAVSTSFGGIVSCNSINKHVTMRPIIEEPGSRGRISTKRNSSG